ncbi:ABC transporter substrate-binding protein [Vibrio sp. 10N]|uniref:ABC transporter substrate-binding protein n=1 Tax=Vibrio sp. 10N TaxID=3058938 RepID=UPI002813EAA0|nr:SgrR family transcriptional regulator [Vibrio sp. 10N]
MRYWNALVFCRDRLVLGEWQTISLDDVSQHLECTRRNAQLLIKRLVKEQVIEWQSGVGRGNLPKAKLLCSLSERLKGYAHRLLEQEQVEAAVSLVPESERELFLKTYLSRYQSTQQAKDILQVPFYRATHALDPITINRRTELHIASYLYASLLKYDASSGEFIGDLAHHWQRDDDGVTVILRKGLTFHDGSALTAASIKAHFERLIHKATNHRAMFQFIDEVKVETPLKLKFVSHRLPHLVPKLLAHSAMGVTKFDQGRVIGSGAFVLAEQTQWRTLLLVNTDYHGHRPWIDGVEIWNLGENAKEIALNCDFVHSRHMAEKANTPLESHQQWERGCVHAMLNPARHPWMKRKRHRRVLQQLLLAMGQPKSAQVETLARASGMMSQPECIQESDLTSLKSALASLPEPGDELRIVTYQLFTHVNTVRLIEMSLKRLGIPCRTTVLEFPVFNSVETLREADIIVTGEVFTEDIEMSWLGWLLGTASNEACFSDERKAWLLEQTVKTMNRPDLKRKLQGFEAIESKLIKEGIYQPLYHVEQEMNVSKKVSAPELLANGWIDFNRVVLNV